MTIDDAIEQLLRAIDDRESADIGDVVRQMVCDGIDEADAVEALTRRYLEGYRPQTEAQLRAVITRRRFIVQQDVPRPA